LGRLCFRDLGLNQRHARLKGLPLNVTGSTLRNLSLQSCHCVCHRRGSGLPLEFVTLDDHRLNNQ